AAAIDSRNFLLSLRKTWSPSSFDCPVSLPYVPEPLLLQLLPGAWLLSIAATSDGERFGAAVIPLRSAHRFVRLTSSSYPTLTHPHACQAAETFAAAHITVGCPPRAAAMLTIQTGQLMVRGLAPLRSDRLVGYSVHLHSSYQQTGYSCLFPQIKVGA